MSIRTDPPSKAARLYAAARAALADEGPVFGARNVKRGALSGVERTRAAYNDPSAYPLPDPRNWLTSLQDVQAEDVPGIAGNVLKGMARAAWDDPVSMLAPFPKASVIAKTSKAGRAARVAQYESMAPAAARQRGYAARMGAVDASLEQQRKVRPLITTRQLTAEEAAIKKHKDAILGSESRIALVPVAGAKQRAVEEAARLRAREAKIQTQVEAQSRKGMGQLPDKAPEKITAAAVTVDGRVFTGANHGEATDAAWEVLRAEGKKTLGKVEDGYVTDAGGRFVGRDEGANVAHKAKQYAKGKQARTDLQGNKVNLSAEQLGFPDYGTTSAAKVKGAAAKVPDTSPPMQFTRTGPRNFRGRTAPPASVSDPMSGTTRLRRNTGETGAAPEAPKLTVKDFQGREGENKHITRNENGHVPTASLAELGGVKGEVRGAHRNRQGPEWEEFKADIKANGIKDPIFVTVDHNGVPKISEGNHRLDAAMELGMTDVPVSIRYFGHAEKQGSVVERAAQKGKPTLAAPPAAAPPMQFTRQGPRTTAVAVKLQDGTVIKAANHGLLDDEILRVTGDANAARGATKGWIHGDAFVSADDMAARMAKQAPAGFRTNKGELVAAARGESGKIETADNHWNAAKKITEKGNVENGFLLHGKWKSRDDISRLYGTSASEQLSAQVQALDAAGPMQFTRQGPRAGTPKLLDKAYGGDNVGSKLTEGLHNVEKHEDWVKTYEQLGAMAGDERTVWKSGDDRVAIMNVELGGKRVNVPVHIDDINQEYTPIRLDEFKQIVDREPRGLVRPDKKLKIPKAVYEELDLSNPDLVKASYPSLKIDAKGNATINAEDFKYLHDDVSTRANPAQGFETPKHRQNALAKWAAENKEGRAGDSVSGMKKPVDDVFDTVVKDAEGNPQELYHHSWNDIEGDFDRHGATKQFGRDPQRMDAVGSWFTSIGEPLYGPKVTKVNLGIKKPFYIDDLEDLDGNVPHGSAAGDLLDKMVKEAGGADAFRQKLLDQGYDGIAMLGTKTDMMRGGKPQDMWITLKENQARKLGTTDAKWK